jgi:hypothetical protein
MTNQHPLPAWEHPLNDEICKDVGTCITILTAPGDPDPYLCPQYIGDDMRAAADWQLEQVIEWLKDNMPKYVYQDYYGADEQQEVFKTLENLKLAMRPTTQDDN